MIFMGGRLGAFLLAFVGQLGMAEAEVGQL
jgi:hypothetical protein